MKKRFLVLIAICFVFTSCVSFWKVSPTSFDEINVHFVNNCAWELTVKIERGLFGIPYSFKLGKTATKLILVRNSYYTIKIKSRLDMTEQSVLIKTGDADRIFHITWDSFDGKYHIDY